MQKEGLLFTTALALVIDLGAQESRLALQRKLKCSESEDFFIIDEIGYLSFDCEADFIFKIVNRRYEKIATCITTNLAFKEWAYDFPGTPCVTAMVDRLTHSAKIIKIAGDSHRAPETKAKKEKRITIEHDKEGLLLEMERDKRLWVILEDLETILWEIKGINEELKESR